MSKARLSHIKDRIVDRELMITVAKAETVAAVLGSRVDLDVSDLSIVDQDNRISGSRFHGESRGVGSEYGYQEFFRLIDGVAVITIDGTLVNKGAWVGANMSGLESYEGIRARIDLAMADLDVNGILLDVESPGGEVFGCFELANHIAQCNRIKPIHAVANGMACSAMYAITASCGRITAIPLCSVGSIGVVMVHVDASAKLEKDGVKPTLIHAGAHKVDGNPYGPLPESVKSSLQHRIDRAYSAFVTHVAEARGLAAEDVRATEAQIFDGEQALALGLIDAIGSFDDALKFLTETPAVSLTAQPRGLSMPTKNGQAAASGGEHQITQADMDAASAAANKEGHDAGVKAEKDRVNGILSLEEAKGREGLAMNAIKNGLTVEQAKGMLADAPKADSPNSGQLVNDGPGQYEQHRKKMEEQQPVLGAGGGQGKKPSAGERLLGLAAKTYGGNK